MRREEAVELARESLGHPRQRQEALVPLRTHVPSRTLGCRISSESPASLVCSPIG